MKFPISRDKYAEIQALTRDLFAEVEETSKILRAELKRRGWTDAEIDAAVKDQQQ